MSLRHNSKVPGFAATMQLGLYLTQLGISADFSGMETVASSE